MKPYIHKVQYYECDGMGVTHHSNYLRIMEEARLDYLLQAGYSYKELEASGIVSPVVKLSIDYRKSTTFDDEIEVETSVRILTAYRLVFRYVMKVRGEVVCTAENVNCFLRDGRPVPVKECLPVI